jgi:DNA-binding NtrC family response regulator
LATAAIAFLCICAGIALGFLLRVALRETITEAKEIVGVGDTTLRVDVDHETAEESPDVRMAFGPLVGASLAMRRLYRTCDALAKSLTPVLVEGEAGTGKLALAEALHLASTPDEPFTVVEGARYESEA